MTTDDLRQALELRSLSNEQIDELLERYEEALSISTEHQKEIYTFICGYGVSVLENKYVKKSDLIALYEEGYDSPQALGWGLKKYNKLNQKLKKLKMASEELANDIGTNHGLPDFSWFESCIEASKPIGKKEFVKNNSGHDSQTKYYIEKFGVIRRGVDNYDEASKLGLILNTLLKDEEAYKCMQKIYDANKKQNKNSDKTYPPELLG